MLSSWSEETLKSYLRDKENEIKRNIAIEKDKLEKINKAVADIGASTMAIHKNVILKEVESQKVVAYRCILENPNRESLLWQQLFDFIIKENIRLPKNYRNMAIFHDLEYKEGNIDVEVCIEVEKMDVNREGIVFRETEPLKTVASMMIYGPFGNIEKGYLKLAEWLSVHPNYKMLGTSRQVSHKGPGNEENPEKYLTEIQIPIKRR